MSFQDSVDEYLDKEDSVETNYHNNLASNEYLKYGPDENFVEVDYKQENLGILQNEEPCKTIPNNSNHIQGEENSLKQEKKQNKTLYGTYHGKSLIWKYFTVSDDPAKSHCNFCQKEVSRGKSGSASKALGNKGMTYHLKKRHAENWNEMENTKLQIELMREKISAREEKRRLELEEDRKEEDQFKLRMEHFYKS